MANIEPDGGVHVTATVPSTRSSAEGANDTIAPSGPLASAVGASGRESVGAVVSSTATVNDELPVLPAASVAEHMTVVSTSRGNVYPDGGAHETGTVPDTRSAAV